MKPGLKIFIKSLVTLLVAGVGLYLWQYNIYNQKENKKEVVSCGSTLEAKCFRYKCETGYLPKISPPGSVGLCSDGSLPIRLEEVLRPY